jgi:hypothetical protein
MERPTASTAALSAAALFRKSLAAVPHALLACSLLGSCVPWPGLEEERSCADAARLDLPIRLADFASEGMIWPHGVHGAAHPEGHPGLDFNLPSDSADLAVFAPISGEIVAATGEENNPGSSCLILDSACIQVNLCHVMLDPGIREGSRILRGQRLGTVAPVPEGGAYSLHFGAYVRSGEQQVCPADFLDPDTVRCVLGADLGGKAPQDCGPRSGAATFMTRSSYPESAARELTLSCADGSKRRFVLPAETSLCNGRLPVEMRSEIESCMGPGCAGVW